jgi:hypothetical protein
MLLHTLHVALADSNDRQCAVMASGHLSCNLNTVTRTMFQIRTADQSKQDTWISDLVVWRNQQRCQQHKATKLVMRYARGFRFIPSAFIPIESVYSPWVLDLNP